MLDIQHYIINNLLHIKVIPSSGRTELKCTEFSTAGTPVVKENSGTQKEPSREKLGSSRSLAGDGRFLFGEENGRLKLYLKAPPDKNKANLELIKFFKKELGLVVEIKSGVTSREKVLRIVR